MFLCYRQGASGAGENYLHRYDAERGTWVRLGKLFSSRGTYAAWNNSPTRNAYLHDLVFDTRNRLHASWIYREAGATWASNHDLHYAYSDDGGLTWLNNAGDKIADLPRDDPIELADRGIVVWNIPVFSWLMNAGCLAIDGKHRPHVMTYKLAGEHRPPVLEHSPPADVFAQLRFVHCFRAEDGTWRGGEPISDPGADGPVARGDIVFGPDDDLYFYYQPRGATGGFRCLESRQAGDWHDWKGYALTTSPYVGLDASKHDRRRWQERGILSFTVLLKPTGFGIVELTLPVD